MTRTVPAAVSTAIGSDAFTMAMVVLVTLSDGSVLTFTDWNENLATDLDGNGSRTFTAGKIETPVSFSAQINTPLDDTELSILIDGTSYIADDVRRGKYDNATVTVGYVLPSNLAAPWLYARYDTAQAKIEGLKLILELLGPEKRLEQPVERVLTANCPWTFGDNDCGMQINADAWVGATAYAVGDIVRRATGTGIYWFKCSVAGTSDASSPPVEPTWPTTLGGTVSEGASSPQLQWTAIYARRQTGTVLASPAPTRKVFTCSGLDDGGSPKLPGDDYFGEGYLTWLTGANAGDTRRVRADNGEGQITLHLPSFDDVSAGDTFDIIVGCRKRKVEDCVGKHDNEANSRTQTLRFGGFDFLAPENVTATADKG